MKYLFTTASILALTVTAASAQAQTSDVTEVIVTGTRAVGVKAADSAAPIEVVGSEALKRTGATDLPDALAASTPSLNVQQNGGDAAALTVQAALRGLNPNDTLVLVNGKRRHTTSDLGVDGGSAYSGASAVDLSFIPVAAIDHVEVLTDGAAAQYGTDAIAGVINVILKDANHGGALSATAGQYDAGDGATGAWSMNKGFGLNDRGFVNVSVEEQYHAPTSRGVGDHRYTTASGAPLAGVDAIDAAGVAHSDGSPNINKLFGDPGFNLYRGLFNAGYDLGGGVRAYAFGSYGQRVASHYQNYRPATKVEGVTSTGQTVIPLPNGFEPSEKFDETDFSFTEGLKGELAGWAWDLSTTYGRDYSKVYTDNSANASLFPALQALSATPIAPQRNFYDGAYVSSELTSTLDLDKSFAIGLASPLNVAIGIEQRRDTYEIDSGETASYFGSGAQSFIGYTPQDQGAHSRTNIAVYGDLSVNPITALHVDLAGRFEHYSDFGDTTVGKLTARYDFNPMIAIRGTASTGFRAPTLAEEYYSGTNVSPIAADVQLPPNSASAALAGFGPLKPEQSDNYSIGFVAHPLPKLQITGDVYDIVIKDRILTSGFLFGEIGGVGTVSQGVLNAIESRGVTLDSGLDYAGISIFSNAADTRTEGAEITANYASSFGSYGDIDWSLGFNYNKNTVTKLTALPSAVASPFIGQTAFLNKYALSGLTTGTPREKLILQAYWTLQKWSVNLRETFYGPSSYWVSFDGSGTGAGAYDERIGLTGITDLDISYKLTSDLRLTIGANNLFNQTPPKTPTVPNGAGGFASTDGQEVYATPYLFAPWGIDGGYYYGRITYTF